MQPERKSRELRTVRVSRRPPRFAATVMALGIIFAVAYVFVLRTPPPVPTPEIQGMKGTYTWQAQAHGATGVPRETGFFSAVASGDAGGQMTMENTAPRAGTFGKAQSAYDVEGRTETTVESASTAVGARDAQTHNVGTWPPVWRVATRSPLDYHGLAAIVRAAVEDGDRSIGIKPIKESDRKVWRAAMKLDGKDIALVVDQLTGIVAWYTDGRSTFTATVDWSSPPPADETYVVKVPAGQKVTTKTDETFSYERSPAAAGLAAGYAPLVSDLAPDGFALKAVATADTMGAPGGWLVHDGASMPVDPLAGQRQVAQLYTRGLSWFTVQQLGPRAAGKAVAYLTDTLRSIAADKLSFETTTLQYGALTGATACTWYDTTGPTLFVSDPRHIVYITGALTRQELISFAEGLKPGSQSSTGSNSSLSTPHSGQTQSSGRSSNAVPGSMSLSGSPTSGS